MFYLFSPCLSSTLSNPSLPYSLSFLFTSNSIKSSSLLPPCPPLPHLFSSSFFPLTPPCLSPSIPAFSFLLLIFLPCQILLLPVLHPLFPSSFFPTTPTCHVLPHSPSLSTLPSCTPFPHPLCSSFFPSTSSCQSLSLPSPSFLPVPHSSMIPLHYVPSFSIALHPAFPFPSLTPSPARLQ